MSEVKPFLKWAGGKRWLINSHSELFPTHFNTYYEPFLGSGAVFFKIRPEKAVLSDTNVELINAFNGLKNNWHRIAKLLSEHHTKHSKEYYYHIRSKTFRSPYERAAQFIYLNRTCWNGLYRVNLNGVFNVPIGTKSSVLFPDDRFDQVAELLQNAKLLVSDFEGIIDQAQEDDFIFTDPPYTANHSVNGFLKYNDKLFSWGDQVRLRDALLRAHRRGVKILVTNAYHRSIIDLYAKEFRIDPLERMSKIAADSEFRRPCQELIISGNRDCRS